MNAWFTQTEELRQLAGWTMIHFLWLGAMVALLGAALHVACRRGGPTLRYAISLTTLAVLALLPIAVAAWLQAEWGRESFATRDLISVAEWPVAKDSRPLPRDIAPVVIDLARENLPRRAVPSPSSRRGGARGGVSATPTPSTSTETNPSPSRPAKTTALRSVATGDRARLLPSLQVRGMELAALVPHLPWLWLVGAPVTFALLTAGLVGSRRLRRMSTPLTTGPVVDVCQRLCDAMRITRRVSLAACDNLAQPILVGIVRPLILLPASALSGWTPEELEMVLLHELAHVRRWDNLVNLLQRIVESLLFFHPAVWLISRQVRRDREECCDAAVLAHTARPEAYATLLVSIAAALRRGQAPPLAAASAMADHPLAGRIRRILNLKDEPMWITRRTLALTFALPLLLAGAMVYTAAAADEEKVGNKEPAETSSETVDLKTDAKASSQDTAESDPVYFITYPTSDRDQINIQKWMQIVGSDPRVDVRWFDENQSIVLGAPESVHKQIAELLAQTRRDGGSHQEQGTQSDVELDQLSREITMLEERIADAKDELVDIEAYKQLAVQSARSPAAVETMVAQKLDKDPTMRMYQEQMFANQAQLQQKLSTSRNRNSADIKRLEAQIQQAQIDMQRYRAQAEKSAREAWAKMPNEQLRAAIAEHDIRYQYITERLKKFEQQLQEAQDRLAALQPDPLNQQVPPHPASAVRVNQQQQPRREFQVFKLRHARASLVALNLEEYFEGDARGELRFIWDAETNTIVAQKATDAQLETIAKLLEVYDQPKNDTRPRTTTDSALKSAKTQPIGANTTLGVEDANDNVVSPSTLEKHKDDLQAKLNQLKKSIPLGHTASPQQESEIKALIQQITSIERLMTGRSQTQTGGKTNARDAQSPFPSLEDQKIADRAYKLLGIELEPATGEDLDRVKELGYAGGLRITGASPEKFASLEGDILVGLHVWPTADLKSLEAILSRDDLGQLSPLKYYIVRNQKPGGFGGGARARTDFVATGRINVDQEALAVFNTEELEEELAAQPAGASTPAADWWWGNIPKDPRNPQQPDEAAPKEAAPPGNRQYWYYQPTRPQGAEPSPVTPVDPQSGTPSPPASPAPAPADAAAGQERIPWRTDLEAAEAEGAKLGKRVLVFFHGPSSTPSRKFERSILNTPEVAKTIASDFIPVKIDVEATPALAAQHQADRVPICRVYARDFGLAFSKYDDVSQFLLELKRGRTLTPSPQSPPPAYPTADDSSAAGKGPLLQPHDVVVLKVVGAFHDQPIDDAYTIEPQGTIALGPTYGRVHVAGKSLLEAEKAVAKHLATMLSDAQVQLTLAAAARQPSLRPSAEDAIYLYDGKTFDQWRDLWKSELKTEKRTEAIEALAAFARAGYGKEAAEAILDVAGEYDFFTIDHSAEGQLKERVLDLLTSTSASRVPETDWLPVLLERLAADPKKWKWLAWHLVGRVETTDESVKELLGEFEKLEDSAIRSAAKSAREWVPEFIRHNLQRDQNGDGKLTSDEVPAADWPLFEPADEDQDGTVTAAELMKAWPEIQSRIRQRQIGQGGIGGGGGGGFF